MISSLVSLAACNCYLDISCGCNLGEEVSVFWEHRGCWIRVHNVWGERSNWFVVELLTKSSEICAHSILILNDTTFIVCWWKSLVITSPLILEVANIFKCNLTFCAEKLHTNIKTFSVIWAKLWKILRSNFHFISCELSHFNCSKFAIALCFSIISNFIIEKITWSYHFSMENWNHER